MIPTTPIFKALLEHDKRDEICKDAALEFIGLFDLQEILMDIMKQGTFKCERSRLLFEVILRLVKEIDFSWEVNQEALERVIHKLLESGYFSS